MTARFGLGTGVSHGRNSRTNGLVRESSTGLTIEVNNFNIKTGDLIHTKLSTIRFSFLLNLIAASSRILREDPEALYLLLLGMVTIAYSLIFVIPGALSVAFSSQSTAFSSPRYEHQDVRSISKGFLKPSIMQSYLCKFSSSGSCSS